MDWNTAIDGQREALKGIVAALVAMVELAATAPSTGEGCDAEDRQSDDCRPPLKFTLPRHLHRAVLRLLRPAESAVRRLVVVLARRLAHLSPRCPNAPAKARRKKTASILVCDGVGTGVVLRHGAPVSPYLAHLAPTKAAPPALAFPLLDPLPRWRTRRRWQPAAGVLRISVAGVTERPAIPAWRPPQPDDRLDAGRLGRRLAALAGALDDLPGQAMRLARWQARRDRALAAGRVHRVTPLRGGRPPGGRLSHYDPDAPGRKNIRDVDEILVHAHALARQALAAPDTS